MTKKTKSLLILFDELVEHLIGFGMFKKESVLTCNNSLILSFGFSGSESPVIVPLLTFIESNIDSIDINTCHSPSGNTTQRSQKAN